MGPGDDWLGEGGIGTVFRVRDELVGEQVAIKMMRAELPNESAIDRARAA